MDTYFFWWIKKTGAKRLYTSCHTLCKVMGPHVIYSAVYIPASWSIKGGYKTGTIHTNTAVNVAQ